MPPERIARQNPIKPFILPRPQSKLRGEGSGNLRPGDSRSNTVTEGPISHRQPNQNNAFRNNEGNISSYSGMNTGYASGGMGFGGMGMGMGMGGYGYGGMRPFGSIGSPGGDPFGWIYSLNSFVFSLMQVMNMLGMNANVLFQSYQMISGVVIKLVAIVKKSKFRRWLQAKSRQSNLVRWLFVFTSMILVSQAVKIVHYVIENSSPRSHGRYHLESFKQSNGPQEVISWDNDEL